MRFIGWQRCLSVVLQAFWSDDPVDCRDGHPERLRKIDLGSFRPAHKALIWRICGGDSLCLLCSQSVDLVAIARSGRMLRAGQVAE